MIRKHKKFSRPKKPFDIVRIKSENNIVKKYGLKNKREIWKAKTKLDEIRRRAKKLLQSSSEEEQKLFLDKLDKLGLKVENVVEVLALTEEDILDRRLQTIVLTKGIATTSRGARQMITHKHILVGDNVVNIPSYHVGTKEEAEIKLLKKNKPKKVVEPKIEEAAKESVEETSQNVEPKIEEENKMEKEIKVAA